MAKGWVPGVKHCGGEGLARLQGKKVKFQRPLLYLGWGGGVGLIPSAIPEPPMSACTNHILSP